LNLEGKREWGEIFLDSKVPVQTIVNQKPVLESAKGVESVFTVNWKELSPFQQQAIIEKLSNQTGTTKEKMLSDILTIGLSIRRTYIRYCRKASCDYSFREEDDFLPELKKQLYTVQGIF
jgi:hypothetical protein